MDWQDEGILVAARRHGESSAIIEVLTQGHGRHVGLVRGGGSRRMTPILQPGARLSLSWQARLEEHLGTFRVDPRPSPLALILADRAALAALGSMNALISASLPEREPHPQLYAATLDLLDSLGAVADWPCIYAAWELSLLSELGFGLDLSRCAATGGTEDLVWVSPRSGCAVSRTGGAPWADRLLPLPGFLRTGWGAGERVAPADLAGAFRLTGFFLEARLGPSLPRETLPAARSRAVDLILRAQADAAVPAAEPRTRA